MKKISILFLLSLFIGLKLYGQSTIEFADSALFNTIIELGYDTNGDSILQDVEANSILALDIRGRNIHDLTGIRWLFNLDSLYCGNNPLTRVVVGPESNQDWLGLSLKFLDVSNSLYLKELNCSSNDLIDLNFDGCDSLERINCDFNNLTALDVTKLYLLTRLECGYNQLTSLDISDNFLLEYLGIYNMPTLAQICVGTEQAPPVGLDVNSSQSPNIYFTNNCSEGKPKSQYSIEDWRNEIDAYWGEGDATDKKLAIFDEIWNKVDDGFNTFHNLDIDWDALRAKYRPEIEASVSQGRFVGIINSMTRQLQETHLWLYNKSINLAPMLQIDQPVMSISSFANNRHFGATLTPLPDSSLLVYKVFPNHPLGLVPGDIILGYEGVPWKKLYKDLLAAELPLKLNGITGSTKEACEHIYLSSAGLNWHLYDVIDFVKYESGDTVHLSTATLAGQTGRIMGSDQVPVTGVDFWADEGPEVLSLDTTNQFYWPNPDINADYFTYGTLENTNIGYIYLATSSENNVSGLPSKLLQAFKTLDNEYVQGIIFDLRYNSGGSWGAMDDVFAYIYTTGFSVTNMYERSSADDHFLMKPWTILYGQDAGTNTITVHANSTTSYDKPIALLTGPGCVSAGEYSILKFKKYPMLRVFGKKTGGTVTVGNFTFNSLTSSSDWLFSQGLANAKLYEDPSRYMSHTGLTVDEEIWLDRNSVANGVDNVVTRAVEWINGTTGIDESPGKNIPGEISLSQNYPNPFNPTTVISYKLPIKSEVNLSIFNFLGQKVTTLVNNKQQAGLHNVQWDATGFASGIYLYTLETSSGYKISKKLLLLK